MARLVVALVALLTPACAVIDAGEVDAPVPVPDSTTAPIAVVDDAGLPSSADPAPVAVVAPVLVDESGTDIAAELDAMEADVAVLDELLAEELLEGTEP